MLFIDLLPLLCEIVTSYSKYFDTNICNLYPVNERQFLKNIVFWCFREKLFELESCIHPTVMKDMCAECGADLRKEDLSMTASVPMVHSIPELKVSEEV